MITIQSNSNLNIIQFTTPTGVKLYGIYNSKKTTLGHIRKSFFDNYSCGPIENKIIIFHYETSIHELILDELDQKLTWDDINNKYGLKDDVKKITIAMKSINIAHEEYNNMDPVYKNKLLNSKKQIFVIAGKKTMTFRYLSDMTVDNLKEQIQNREGIPVEEQRLISYGKQLQDDRTMDYYKIDEDDTIHLFCRLRGGMFHETSGRSGNFKPLKDCFFEITSDL